jgi:hypothetical protein
MMRVCFRAAIVAVVVVFVSFSAAGQSAKSDNPDSRAEALDLACKANNKQGANAAMHAIATESDGPAGFRMAQSIEQLTSEEALDVVEKSVLTFSKPENLFGAYWTFIGMARQNTERSNAIIRKAIVDSRPEQYLLRAAAIEALAYTARSDQADLLLEALRKLDPKRLELEQAIVTYSSVHAAPKLAKTAEKKLRDDIVLELANVLERVEDDRLQWHTCKALSVITGEDMYIDPAFWRWWVEVGGKVVERRADEGPTVASRDVPKFFKAAAVGKRVVFVIDVSGSMKHPVEVPAPPPPPAKEEPKRPVTGSGSGKGGKGAGDKEPEKPKIPPPDYSRVRTKLDLAKVELIHTLTYLPEDYWFNIVTYHTPHSMIDGGTREFVQATEANKKKFIKKVEALSPLKQTNIHGGLVRAFCVNDKKSLDPAKIGKKENNPAWDPECLRTGATTIFFLTDGHPTISDDTTNGGEVGRPGGARRGNGRMVKGRNIIADVQRMNTFRKVVINTIGIGPHSAGLMDALARMTGGEYIDRSGATRHGD